jgi:hypothetical protein
MNGVWLAVTMANAVVTVLLAVLALGMHRRLQPLLDSSTGTKPAELSWKGLGIGEAVGAFDAVDAEGRSWESLPVAGPLLVLLTMPGCAPCDALLNVLVGESEPLPLPLVVVTSDTAQGRLVAAPPWSLALYQRGQSVSRAFQSTTSPHVFLVDRTGRVSATTIPGSREDLLALTPTTTTVEPDQSSLLPTANIQEG